MFNLPQITPKVVKQGNHAFKWLFLSIDTSGYWKSSDRHGKELVQRARIWKVSLAVWKASGCYHLWPSC